MGNIKYFLIYLAIKGEIVLTSLQDIVASSSQTSGGSQWKWLGRGQYIKARFLINNYFDVFGSALTFFRWEICPLSGYPGSTLIKERLGSPQMLLWHFFLMFCVCLFPRVSLLRSYNSLHWPEQTRLCFSLKFLYRTQTTGLYFLILISPMLLSFLWPLDCPFGFA